MSFLDEDYFSEFSNSNIDYDGYLLFDNKPIAYVVIRQLIRRDTFNQFRYNSFKLPLIIFAKESFAFINPEDIPSFKIDDDEFDFYDGYKSFTTYQMKFFNEYLKHLIYIINKKQDLNHKRLISNTLNEIFIGVRKELRVLEDDIEDNEDNYSYKLSVKAANNFFNYLLNDYKGKLYRYTSQDSIFQTILSEKHRMNGLAGMNDIEEINYTDTYLYDGRFTPASSKNYNNKFILSCCNEKSYDDLTMYRLYADDAKGVCVEYTINNQASNNYYIKAVEYANKDGKNPTLELLKRAIENIEKTTGRFFDFFGDSGWKYFFKPYEYQIENEVRILFDNSNHDSPIIKRGWIVTTNNKIVNPFIEFSLDAKKNPPIIINSITLGPKHPEMKINLKQYKDYCYDHALKIGKIDIKESKIKNYR